MREVETALAESLQELTKGNSLIADLRERVASLTRTLDNFSEGAIKARRRKDWGEDQDTSQTLFETHAPLVNNNR